MTPHCKISTSESGPVDPTEYSSYVAVQTDAAAGIPFQAVGVAEEGSPCSCMYASGVNSYAGERPVPTIASRWLVWRTDGRSLRK
ncbi:uncharacterized protein PAC_14254 [Phialocephala subalpina]|uniref:Uncharacterized protein n=1 Tax=Phialocephala subalpina TaxID=576137 RepID=A0A1L7XHC7_9HELO|nr:uncharacterized protein PAC_14254 [Phialocephala subalpina]